ncbi:2-succinyl-5-enolpyruvyl-6-hydroxy-3-cyclohexene-1-carboxylic-acid synthase [Bacillaceae bacterium SIJ1]|uniref:2-succinyl-5-enolpyruvyl-6-hydroxy-3- cyclohexene-1-carboxylic-acid synthase n=1 Tax=Litoribacterium kuwaitense TaxID=1398745 RepID=UPI0013EB9E97|nr:2-succinyl-5-enolpyruvyl-6-hydroxy-3-cyclohexene-1-carboxylic-acid synthase [Litoribacterium kuwaitense]NGP44239.1 2-succinyl-5-enolpyruvyl-6-hydroxy-3-cyclohexene-1-carboxylic-acid synthase [Litoribacterium kuwaitense]
MDLASSNTLAAFVQALNQSGVGHVVISPGSRSTPLALLFTRHPQMKEWVLLDERSAGFFALGLAKRTQQPVVLLCTSGTAASNYLPAVTEAKHGRVPLIVVTADRPHELRDVGAPQAIHQPNMYQNYVKWEVDLPIPDGDEATQKYLTMAASRAAHISSQSPAGPVHLNAPFREPLSPHLDCTFTGHGTLVRYLNTEWTLCSDAVPDMIQWLNREKPLIIWGPDQFNEQTERILTMAQQFNWPVLADPLSQLRQGEGSVFFIDQYDNFLRESAHVDALQPEVIVRVGAHPVSKALQKAINQWSQEAAYIVWDEEAYNDPTLNANIHIQAKSERFVRMINIHNRDVAPADEKWLGLWQHAQNVSLAETQCVEVEENLQEHAIFPMLRNAIASYDALFVGNSMPIRDCDSFFHSLSQPLAIYANRGVNGIDGVVSTALGVAAAGCRVLLVLGDVSMYHDLNGLLAAKLYQLPVTIVVVHNDGGGIFSFLPQKKMTEAEEFSRLFETPHGLDFSYAASLYGASYEVVSSPAALERAVEPRDHLHIVVVKTSQPDGVEERREKWKRIRISIDGRRDRD